MAEGVELPEGSHRKIAVFIAVLAAFLAIAETGAKSAQTEVLAEHVEATNLWSFFQAKTVRQAVIRTAAEEMEAQYKDTGAMPPAVKAQIQAWRATVQRYDNEPDSGEGRNELTAAAKVHERAREVARASYHLFEFGSAAFQLAIVLASASAVTSVMLLAWLSGGLGLAGAVLTTVGFLAPGALHL